MEHQGKSSIRKHLDFIILDILCLLVAFTVAYFIHEEGFDFYHDSYTLNVVIVMVLIELCVSYFVQPFKEVLKRGYLVGFQKTVYFVFFSGITMIVYLFLTKQTNIYTRVNLVLTYILYFVLSYTTRCIWKYILMTRFKNAINEGNHSLVVITKFDNVKDVISKMTEKNFDQYQITGLCIYDKQVTGIKVEDIDVVASGEEEILNYLRANWIDQILVNMNYWELPKDFLKGIAQSGISTNFMISELEVFEGQTQRITKVNSYYVLNTCIEDSTPKQMFMKRAIDICGGLIGSLFTILLFVIIGPIIYIKSPGPIIFKQDRVGKNGKVFKFYKFRSMVTNADDLKQELAEQNRVKDGFMFKLDHDPRIIPGIGEFIRKTSLDEFPQFFNVLKGDMSLVGTRPPTLDEWTKYKLNYRQRLLMKPGITGLWQISGRSEITDFDKVVELDTEYIKNFSILLDFKILLKTIEVIIKRDGAL